MRRGAHGALVVLLVLLAACSVPSRPSEADWRSQARQALEDTASYLSTMRLVLEAKPDEPFLGGYDVVVATHAEEAASSTAETLTTAQPPPPVREEYDEVSALLGDAGDLLSEARIALAADREREYAGLAAQLRVLAVEATDLREELR